MPNPFDDLLPDPPARATAQANPFDDLLPTPSTPTAVAVAPPPNPFDDLIAPPATSSASAGLSPFARLKGQLLMEGREPPLERLGRVGKTIWSVNEPYVLGAGLALSRLPNPIPYANQLLARSVGQLAARTPAQQAQEREEQARFPAASMAGQFIGSVPMIESGLGLTRAALPRMAAAIPKMRLAPRLLARGAALAPTAGAMGAISRGAQAQQTGEPTTMEDVAKAALTSALVSIPLGAAAEALGTAGRVLQQRAFRQAMQGVTQAFVNKNPHATPEQTEQFIAALSRQMAQKGWTLEGGMSMLQSKRILGRLRAGKVEIPTLQKAAPVTPPPTPPEGAIAPPVPTQPQPMPVQPSAAINRTAIIQELGGPDVQTRFGAVGQLSDQDLMRVREEQQVLPSKPHVKIAKSIIELLPEETQAAQDALEAISAGEAGFRKPTETGEWVELGRPGYPFSPGAPADKFGAIYGPFFGRRHHDRLLALHGTQEYLRSEDPAITFLLSVRGSKFWLKAERRTASGNNSIAVAYLHVEPTGESIINGSYTIRPKDPLALLVRDRLLEFLQSEVTKIRRPPNAPPALPLPGTEPTLPPGKIQPPQLIQEGAGELFARPPPVAEQPIAYVPPASAVIPPADRATAYQVDPSVEAPSAAMKPPAPGLSEKPITTARINKTQLLQYIWDAFKIPTRGFATHPAGARAGFHAPHEILSRIKVWGDLETLMHETAHGIDAQVEHLISGRRMIIGRGRTQWYRAIGKTPAERTQLLKELSDLDYDQKQRRSHEGFAEYMRHWLTDDGQAIQLAPTFHRLFQTFLASGHPDLHAKLLGLQQRYQIWRDQGALARMSAQVDWKGEHTKLPVKQQVVKVIQQVENRFIDELQPILRLMEGVGVQPGELEPKDDPFKWATFSKQKSSGIARTFIETAAVDEFGNVIGPSLVEVLRPIVTITNLGDLFSPAQSQTLKNFFTYALALRSKHLATRGIESGFEFGDVDAVIQQFDAPTWRQAADALTTWAEHPIKWLERAGGLSPGTADIFRSMNPVYVMMKRAFLDDPAARLGTGRLFSSGKPVHEIKGSGRAVIHPLFSMVEQMAQLIGRAHKMRVAGLIADLATREGAGAWVNEVPLARKATTFQLEQIYSQLQKAGYHVMVQIKSTGELFPAKNPLSADTLDELLTVFTHTPYYTGKDTIVPVFRKGKLKLYELHPDVFQSLQGLDAIQINAITKYTAPFTRLKRLGATGVNPAFGLIRNPFKDAFTYALFSRNPWATPLDPLIRAAVRRMRRKVGPGTFPFRFRAAGGDISSQLGYDRAQTMGVLDDALLKTLGPLGQTLHVVKHPVDALRRIINIPELWPRIAEGESMMAQLKREHPTWTPESVFIDAFNAGQDVTINFSKSGSWGKQINQADFTFNASTQGLNKLYREATAHPWRTGARGVLWLSIPAIASWWQNKDKQWYKNLPPAYRYTNFWMEVGSQVIRLPIPYDIGVVFAALPVAMLDATHEKNPALYQGLIELAISQVPPISLDAVGPLWDVARNRDYLNRPIETESMRRELVTDRSTPTTAQWAKTLSRAFAAIGWQASPKVLEYVIEQYTGGIGRNLGDLGRPIREPSDFPVVGRQFSPFPEEPTYQLDRFYEQWTWLQQQKTSQQLPTTDLTTYTRHRLAAEHLTRIRKQIRAAQETRNRAAIRGLYRQEADVLKQAGYP